MQFTNSESMPKSINSYIHVLWWFNKFDDKKYRRILQCETPYESEGKTGVFACRAPIRPNPVAITTVKVLRKDYDNSRIYINSIESFDHTPFFGVIDYSADFDKHNKRDLLLPDWTSTWPEEIIVNDEQEINKIVSDQVKELDDSINLDIVLNQISNYFTKSKTMTERPAGIIVKGARENNLKGVSVSIPYGKITAVVGVSGSGKSSLVIDTVYAECQRRMEHLSSENAMRQSPDIESMNGCIPVVMISQKEIRANANSTIGTFSGINQHLRSIYASIGKRHSCNTNGVQFKLTPATFSFLDPECRCSSCNGKGVKSTPDIDKIITNQNISLLDGASPILGKLKTFIDNPNANWMKGQAVALAEEYGVDLSKPWKELPDDYKKVLLYGDKNKTVTFSFNNKKTGRKGDISRAVEGIIPTINRLYIEDDKGGMSNKFMSEKLCDVCNGERLAYDGRLATVLGVRFPIAASMSFDKARQFAIYLKENLPWEELELVKEHIDSIIAHCDIAIRLGIEYLEMSRGVSMISGGEASRLKLLSAFLNHMSGILYIFDEPSKKLSSKEYGYIIDMIRELINEGNTVLMVEHNMDMIRIADYVIEIGPKAGRYGGYLMAEGTLDNVVRHNNSMLGKYAENYDSFEKNKKTDFESWIEVKNITANNLNNVNVRFPKGALTCITGVSGSGKSSLLYKGILPRMEQGKEFESVILVESKIAGSSSRSVVATYVGIMDDIRSIFAKTDASLDMGLIDKDFSFNTGKLRCNHCNGDGRIKIPYTEDSYGVCPICHGRRYSKEADCIVINNKTIADVLKMSVEEAEEFFSDINPAVAKKCQYLTRVGLSYILIGQSTSMLSGGEAARLKMASCLMNTRMDNSLFLLDEPTCGLHFSDIDNLIDLLEEIISLGNTVVAIEHNKRFLSAADYTIIVGPGAGRNGGKILED